MCLPASGPELSATFGPKAPGRRRHDHDLLQRDDRPGGRSAGTGVHRGDDHQHAHLHCRPCATPRRRRTRCVHHDAVNAIPNQQLRPWTDCHVGERHGAHPHRRHRFRRRSRDPRAALHGRGERRDGRPAKLLHASEGQCARGRWSVDAIDRVLPPPHWLVGLPHWPLPLEHHPNRPSAEWRRPECGRSHHDLV